MPMHRIDIIFRATRAGGAALQHCISQDIPHGADPFEAGRIAARMWCEANEYSLVDVDHVHVFDAWGRLFLGKLTSAGQWSAA